MKTCEIYGVLHEIQRRSGKIYLKTGIKRLTSEIFFTFVSVTTAVSAWLGIILENRLLLAASAIVWLLGFLAWSLKAAPDAI